MAIPALANLRGGLRARLSAAVTLAVVVAGAAWSTSSAAAATDVSTNWAGYAVTAPSTTFTSVTGTWKEPTVTCGVAGAGTSSAFWVGLGGYSANSQALEQIGTSADCTDRGKATYYAWYELVPSASVNIKLTIKPGDTITTSVNIVNGTTVEVQVKNRTRRTSFTKNLTFDAPDISSAEWVAEAPSQCDQFRCTPVPLANFSSVSFSRIAAVGNGIGGTITNPSWTASSIQLVPSGSRGFFPGPNRFGSDSGSTAGATPGGLSADGKSFAVAWQADASAG